MAARIAFFDIDGVLANDTHRVAHALAKRWDSYFRLSALAADLVWPQGRAALEHAQEEGWEIAYLTGRREDLRPTTVAWLLQNNFPQGILLMRPVEVKKPLANLKTDILTAIRVTAPETQLVLYDDDPEVVRLVRASLGEHAAVHCTWHIKQQALVRTANA